MCVDVDLFERANLRSDQSLTASNDGKTQSSQQHKQEDECYSSDILLATAKLERNCTGDRITTDSSEWVKDFSGESLVMGPMHPSLFTPDNASTTSASPLSSPADSHEEGNLPLALSQQHDQSLPLASSSDSILPTKTAAADASSSSSTSSIEKKSKRKKGPKPRVLDKSCTVEKNDHDILFGRGRFTNKHPGNIYFRQKALELLPLYKQTPKEEKRDITNLLVETIKGEGRRFLEKGGDNLWHEVVDGVYSKASQTFRDLDAFRGDDN